MLEGKNIAASKRTRLNDQIRAAEVRLIDKDGTQLGIVDLAKAKDVAQTAGMDLVEISPGAEPPVCRVMDYGKYVFEQKKKKNASRKKQRQIQLKEVKLRPGTEDGDLQVKIRNIMRFLEANDKVKVTLRFRGREFVHNDLGFEMMKRIAEAVDEIGQVEFPAKMEGRQMLMILVPKKK